LEGKVAVVTGAGRGLGRAYVELLAERGARVVVNDLGTDVSGFGKDSTIAEQVPDLIRSRGGEAIADDSDVSTPEGGSALIARTIEHFGRIDLLVNNAGICGSQLFEDATLADFDHYWRVHLGGPVNTVKAAWPHMVAQRYGKIILTTSVVGLFGMRGQATYAAAKSAVVGLMCILAIEGAEHGILVNTISPVGYTGCTRPRDPACLKQMEEPPCRLRLSRQRSSGWQAMVVRIRAASTTWKPEQSNVSLSSWDLASTIHI
jgi:NAD(P)-dependent dehydrogenase (short-subunit alcohol dehydrogenase family)